MSAADVTITFLTAERFAAKPQIGLHVTQDWHSLVRGVTWPTIADGKQSAGAWCPCVLERGIVKDGRGPMSLLVFDVDDCAEGAIARSAAALDDHAGAIIPTFSATPAQPKHRIVLLPSRPLTPDEFSVAWPHLTAVLAGCEVAVDRTCKNVNRLYFACVARSPEAWLGARILTGAPVDVDAMLVAARELAERDQRWRAEQARARRPIRHRDRYIDGAIRKAHGNIACASEGDRHETLLREAYSLARLGLTDGQIADALLDVFVAVAGKARQREGERAIRDAVAARAKSGAA